MNIVELIQAFRVAADDMPDDAGDDSTALHTGAWIVQVANEATREAAERSRLIRDDATEDVCKIDLVPGQRDYDLHHTIIDINTARLGGTRNVWLVRAAEPWWRGNDAPATVGPPRRYAVTARGSLLTLTLDRQPPDPAIIPPSYDDTIRLEVFRRPLASMACPDPDPDPLPPDYDPPEIDSPEIPGAYHNDLLYWMLYRSYSTRDSDKNNHQAAMDNLALFEQAFGKKIDRNVWRKQLRHRPTICKQAAF